MAQLDDRRNAGILTVQCRPIEKIYLNQEALMTFNSAFRSSLAVIAVTVSVNASQLGVSEPVKDFLSSLSAHSIARGVDLTDRRLLDSALVSSRPVIYEITNRSFSATDVQQFVEVAGVADSLQKFAGYDEKKGACYFNSPCIKPLADESPAGLEDLKQKAFIVLEKLLGAESGRFVFANTETDWAMSKPDTEAAERRIIQTYRFTRKINGCHIIDNTAYVRISFTGKGELCGFEIRNPDLQPVALDRMVKLSATKTRLEQFAGAKKTVRSSRNETINVSSITAKKGIQAYLSQPAGGKVYLIPGISILCRYALDNGDVFEKYEHFFIDASRVSNIDEDMLEPSRR